MASMQAHSSEFHVHSEGNLEISQVLADHTVCEPKAGTSTTSLKLQRDSEQVNALAELLQLTQAHIQHIESSSETSPAWGSNSSSRKDLLHRSFNKAATWCRHTAAQASTSFHLDDKKKDPSAQSSLEVVSLLPTITPKAASTSPDQTTCINTPYSLGMASCVNPSNVLKATPSQPAWIGPLLSTEGSQSTQLALTPPPLSQLPPSDPPSTIAPSDPPSTIAPSHLPHPQVTTSQLPPSKTRPPHMLQSSVSPCSPQHNISAMDRAEAVFTFAESGSEAGAGTEPGSCVKAESEASNLSQWMPSSNQNSPATMASTLLKEGQVLRSSLSSSSTWAHGHHPNQQQLRGSWCSTVIMGSPECSFSTPGKSNTCTPRRHAISPSCFDVASPLGIFSGPSTKLHKTSESTESHAVSGRRLGSARCLHLDAVADMPTITTVNHTLTTANQTPASANQTSTTLRQSNGQTPRRPSQGSMMPEAKVLDVKTSMTLDARASLDQQPKGHLKIAAPGELDHTQNPLLMKSHFAVVSTLGTPAGDKTCLQMNALSSSPALHSGSKVLLSLSKETVTEKASNSVVTTVKTAGKAHGSGIVPEVECKAEAILESAGFSNRSSPLQSMFLFPDKSEEDIADSEDDLCFLSFPTTAPPVLLPTNDRQVPPSTTPGSSKIFEVSPSMNGTPKPSTTVPGIQASLVSPLSRIASTYVVPPPVAILPPKGPAVNHKPPLVSTMVSQQVTNTVMGKKGQRPLTKPPGPRPSPSANPSPFPVMGKQQKQLKGPLRSLQTPSQPPSRGVISTAPSALPHPPLRQRLSGEHRLDRTVSASSRPVSGQDRTVSATTKPVSGQDRTVSATSRPASKAPSISRAASGSSISSKTIVKSTFICPQPRQKAVNGQHVECGSSLVAGNCASTVAAASISAAPSAAMVISAAPSAAMAISAAPSPTASKGLRKNLLSSSRAQSVGKPVALPTPLSVGKPVAFPTPPSVGKPVALPTPPSVGKPVALPTPPSTSRTNTLRRNSYSRILSEKVSSSKATAAEEHMKEENGTATRVSTFQSGVARQPYPSDSGVVILKRPWGVPPSGGSKLPVPTLPKLGPIMMPKMGAVVRGSGQQRGISAPAGAATGSGSRAALGSRSGAAPGCGAMATPFTRIPSASGESQALLPGPPKPSTLYPILLQQQQQQQQQQLRALKQAILSDKTAGHHSRPGTTSPSRLPRFSKSTLPSTGSVALKQNVVSSYRCSTLVGTTRPRASTVSPPCPLGPIRATSPVALRGKGSEEDLLQRAKGEGLTEGSDEEGDGSLEEDIEETDERLEEDKRGDR